MMFRRFCDLFFVGRPMLLIPVWAYFIFGYIRGLEFAPNNKYSLEFVIPVVQYPFRIIYGLDLKSVLSLTAFSVLMMGVHILNQIADIETDKKNAGFPLLARGVIRKRTVMIETAVFFAASIITAAIIGKGFLILFVCAILLGYVYSMPPLRWSGRPILDFLSNAVGYGFITFFLGWMSSGNQNLEKMFICSLPYFLLMTAGSIASTIPDMPGDEAEGKKTTSVWLGIRISAALGITELVCAGIIGWFLNDMTAVVVAAFALTAFLRLFFRPVLQNAYPAYQLGGGLLVLVALLIFPPLLGVSLLFFIATKAYFYFVHNVNYPKLGT